MADDLVVEREILLEGDGAEVWPLLASADGWQQWLVDVAAVEVAEGSVGEITDDGVTRLVRVTEVDEHHRLAFQWWERDDPSEVSKVSIEVLPMPGGTSLVRVTERVVGLSMKAGCSTTWEVRALLLTLTQCTLARV